MRTKMSIVSFSLAGLLASGCILGTDATEQREDVEGEEGDEGDDDDDEGGDRDDCKVEGSAIGQVGASVTVGGTTVVFEAWEPKLDSPGEYVGFTLSTGAMHYVVKTGGELHEASGATWSHPNGYEGPDVPGISNVDFCDPPPDDCYCEDDEGGEDDGGGDDGGGDDDGGTDVPIVD